MHERRTYVLSNLLPAANSYFSHNTLASDISVLVKSSQHLLFLDTFGSVDAKLDDIFFLPDRISWLWIFLNWIYQWEKGYEKQFCLLMVGK